MERTEPHPTSLPWRRPLVALCLVSHAALFCVIVPCTASILDTSYITLPGVTELLFLINAVVLWTAPLSLLGGWWLWQVAPRRGDVALATYAVSAVIWIYAAFALYLPFICASVTVIGKNQASAPQSTVVSPVR